MNRISANSHRSRQRGFTILELLMVIAIIATLAALGIPAISGLVNSRKSGIATRQLADDLKLARNRAITERTTVYMVFVPPDFSGLSLSVSTNASATELALNRRDISSVQKLLDAKYTTYALFTWRSVGEQPGVRNPRYLTAWRSLPEGNFIAPSEFEAAPQGLSPASADWWRNHAVDRPLPQDFFPFPSDASSGALAMPYIAFDHKGQLVQPTYLGFPLEAQLDEALHIGQGSILYPREIIPPDPAFTNSVATSILNNEFANGNYLPVDIVETPPGNSSNVFVRINWLTGRAELDVPQIRD